jgi:hypothetical protein
MSCFRHWKIIAGMSAVFVAGLLIGGIVTLRVVQKSIRERMDPTTWTPRTLAWLHKELQITDQQEAEVRPAIERAMRQLAELKTQVDGQRKQTFAEMFVEISQHLTEPQRERLRKRLREAAASEAALSHAGSQATGP